jgi:O-antigen/teichoic acid export membrane protein
MKVRDADAPAESIFRPALLLMSGRVVGLAASFAIPIVLVRVFDQADFGTYKQLFLIAATLYGVGQLGMAESLFYFIPRAPRDAARYVTNALLALGAGGLACLAGLSLGGEHVARWLGNAELARHTTALGVYMLLWLASAGLEIVMISRKRYRSASWLYGALDLLRAGLLIVPALLVPDLRWLLAGAVVFAAVRVATALVYVRREFGAECRPDGRLLGAQLGYAMPFALSGIVEIAQVNLHQYAVAYRFDAATFAIYAVGCLQIPLVELVASTVINVMMVRMSEELRDGRDGAARAAWHDSARKLALLFFPLAVLLAVAAQPVMVLLFTERYAASAPVFMVSCLGLLWYPIAVDGVLRVHAATRFLFALNIGRLLLTAALIWWLLPRFGLVGAMLGTVLADAAARTAGLVRIGVLTGARPARLLPWSDLGAALAAAVAAALPAELVRVGLDGAPLPALAATGLVYGAAYLACLWAFGGVRSHEWSEMRRLLERARLWPGRAGAAWR